MTDEKAAEAVFQKYKHVRPRLNRAAIGLLCSEYEAAKEPVSLERCALTLCDGICEQSCKECRRNATFVLTAANVPYKEGV
jgi:hypothetical protein